MASERLNDEGFVIELRLRLGDGSLVQTLKGSTTPEISRLAIRDAL